MSRKTFEAVISAQIKKIRDAGNNDSAIFTRNEFTALVLSTKNESVVRQADVSQMGEHDSTRDDKKLGIEKISPDAKKDAKLPKMPHPEVRNEDVSQMGEHVSIRDDKKLGIMVSSKAHGTTALSIGAPGEVHDLKAAAFAASTACTALKDKIQRRAQLQITFSKHSEHEQAHFARTALKDKMQRRAQPLITHSKLSETMEEKAYVSIINMYGGIVIQNDLAYGSPRDGGFDHVRDGIFLHNPGVFGHDHDDSAHDRDVNDDHGIHGHDEDHRVDDDLDEHELGDQEEYYDHDDNDDGHDDDAYYADD
jgi:hypothetical protein